MSERAAEAGRPEAYSQGLSRNCDGDQINVLRNKMRTKETNESSGRIDKIAHLANRSTRQRAAAHLKRVQARAVGILAGKFVPAIAASGAAALRACLDARHEGEGAGKATEYKGVNDEEQHLECA